MSTPPDHSPEAFFRELRAAFDQTWQSCATDAHSDARSQAVLQQAWSSFDGNVAIQSEGQPPIACHKGCPSCCTPRVSALAPEAFMIAAFVRATAPALQRHDIDLVRNLREADAATRGLDEAQRVALRRPCPFLVQDLCFVHRVRPLACRGHASHDKQACVQAGRGEIAEVPVSGPHRVVRLLVQSALQASLRNQHLAWGAYELNHAVVLALDNAQAGAAWLAGADPLAAAALDSAEQRQAMGAWFDEA